MVRQESLLPTLILFANQTYAVRLNLACAHQSIGAYPRVPLLTVVELGEDLGNNHRFR